MVHINQAENKADLSSWKVNVLEHLWLSRVLMQMFKGDSWGQLYVHIPPLEKVKIVIEQGVILLKGHYRPHHSMSYS